MRTAILHIGPPKTGSTSIQRFLHASRDDLLARGFVVPAFAGKRNHIALAAVGARENYDGNARRRAGSGDDLDGLRTRLVQDLASEMASIPASVHTVIFSSEQLAVRVKDEDGVRRLQSLLTPHFDRFRVVVYLRRQDEIAVSRYSTGLRAGGVTTSDLFPEKNDENGVYFLHEILDRYASVFGKEAVQPRMFNRKDLVNGDVVTDFLHAIGISDLTPPPENLRNPSLRANVQELLRLYNSRVERRGLANRPWLGQFLRDERYWGKGCMPSRAAAEEFLSRFADGNETIRRTWFPESKSLFAGDFSRYPEVDDRSTISSDMIVDAALDVLVDLALAVQEAETERRMALGRQALAEGRVADARNHFTRILREVNDHRAAAHGLREIGARRPDTDLAGDRSDQSQSTRKEKSVRKAKRQDDKLPETRAAPRVPVSYTPTQEKLSPAQRKARREDRRMRGQQRGDATERQLSPAE